MNEVTSRFVPNLRPEQDNKVSGALAPPTKMVSFKNKYNSTKKGIMFCIDDQLIKKFNVYVS